MADDPPVGAAIAVRPRIDFTVVEVDNGAERRELGIAFRYALSPVSHEGIAAFVAEFGNHDGLAVTGDTGVFGRKVLGKRLVTASLVPVVLLQAKDREPDEIDDIIAGIKGLKPLIALR